jgi:hypothetical protein
MRMRHFLGTFEKIPSPDLSGYLAQFPGKRFKQGEGNEKLQCPNNGFRNLALNDARKGSSNLNVPGNFPRQFCKFLKTVWSPFRVNDVRTEEGAAAIEFKIEVAAIGFGLRKEFDATVFPNFVEVIRANTANVAIVNLKNPMEDVV